MTKVRAVNLAATILFSFVACRADVGYAGRSRGEWISELESPDTETRLHAADALGKILEIQPQSHDVVDALSRALRDTSDEVRLAAATALTREGVDILGALEGFHAILHDSAHADVRAVMALIVGSLGRQRGKLLIPVLREALYDADPEVRATAVESLAMVDQGANEIRLEIARLANDPSPRVRLQVVQAMLNLRADAALTLRVVRPALRDSVSSIRSAAGFTVGALGPAGLPALPEIIRLLHDTDPLVRTAAAFAIGAMGPPARGALPRLAELLRDSSVQVTTQAKEAIAAVEGKKVSPNNREPTTQERCGVGSRSSTRC
ncbi:MAG: HEAT repeat domain-containing protein [Gemmatimonadaceae bacterium]